MDIFNNHVVRCILMLAASLSPVFANDEGSPENEEMAAIRKAVQANYARIVEVTPNDDPGKVSFQKVDLSGSVIDVNGKNIYAFRFSTPKKAADLVWAFSRPMNMYRWYIAPEKERMVGFRNFETKKLNRDIVGIGAVDTRVYLQLHPSNLLKTESGYAIWLQFFDGASGNEVALSLNMFTPGSYGSLANVFSMLD